MHNEASTEMHEALGSEVHEVYDQVQEPSDDDLHRVESKAEASNESHEAQKAAARRTVGATVAAGVGKKGRFFWL